MHLHAGAHSRQEERREGGREGGRERDREGGRKEGSKEGRKERQCSFQNKSPDAGGLASKFPGEVPNPYLDLGPISVCTCTQNPGLQGQRSCQVLVGSTLCQDLYERAEVLSSSGWADTVPGPLGVCTCTQYPGLQEQRSCQVLVGPTLCQGL